MPRSSKVETLSAAAMRRAAARISCSSTPHSCGAVAHGHVDAALRAHCVCTVRVRRPGTRDRRGPPERSCRAAAARHQASVPGPRSQVEVGQLGGLGPDGIEHDQRSRSGSRAISRRVTRARGKLCDCHGFLPTNTATSECSKSPLV